jgi:hypothetical protein
MDIARFPLITYVIYKSFRALNKYLPGIKYLIIKVIAVSIFALT